jgi:hypothetical protein
VDVVEGIAGVAANVVSQDGDGPIPAKNEVMMAQPNAGK